MPVVVPSGRFHNDRFPVTPEQFGAIGDGVVEDTDAVQAAFTSAGGGGAVYLSPGKTYLCDLHNAVTVLTTATLLCDGHPNRSWVALTNNGLEV